MAAEGVHILNGGLIYGNVAEYGGGVCVLDSGWFTMGSDVIGSNAASYGGGIGTCGSGTEPFVYNCTILVMGGAVTHNAAAYGGGAYVTPDTLFNLQSTPRIYENYDSGYGNSNVYLKENAYICLPEALGSDASVGVTAASEPSDGTPVRVTAGFTYENGEDASDAFFSDSSDLKISFDGGLGDGGEVVLAPKQRSSSWMALQEQIGTKGQTQVKQVDIKLTEDVVADSEDDVLLVPAGVVVNLDLNGHTIDRGLTAPADDGGVFLVQGYLALNDSSSAGTGKITGGSTTGRGGGIYVYSGEITIDGGEYYTKGQLVIDRCTVSGNSAAYVGGTLYFEGGRITGNRAKNNGGGIMASSNGRAAVLGGSITGNTAGKSGGGACAFWGGQLYMTGGSITGNTAGESGGGVSFLLAGFGVEGSPVVTGNKLSDGSANNVYVVDPYETMITVTGALSDQAKIGVNTYTAPTAGAPVTFTDGLSGRGTQSAFTSDGSGFKVGTDENSEAMLGVGLKKITFAAGGASGTMGSAAVVPGGRYTLPEPGFAAPQGKSFAGWKRGSDTALLQSGDVITVNSDITLTAVWSNPWGLLQEWINAAADGSTVTLTDDITAAADDAALVIPAGKNLTLDLAGHTLSRGLTRAAENGSVIVNNGTLTIQDTSEEQTGTITGGYNSGSGGAVYNSGTLTIESGSFVNNTGKEAGAVFNASGAALTVNGGTFSGNRATTWGGGAVVNYGTMTMTGGTITGNSVPMNGGVWTNSSFTMTGGTITGNTADNGGGVYFKSGTFRISGDPVISGNTPNNVNMLSGTKLTVIGPLSESAKIGVRPEASGSSIVIASGLAGNGTAENFFSDKGSYAVGLNAGGDAFLGAPATVSFDAGEGGSGTAEDMTTAAGGLVVLPESGFTAPSGMEFDGWQVDGTKYAAGDSITVTEDTTVTALWKDTSSGGNGSSGGNNSTGGNNSSSGGNNSSTGSNSSGGNSTTGTNSSNAENDGSSTENGSSAETAVPAEDTAAAEDAGAAPEDAPAETGEAEPAPGANADDPAGTTGADTPSETGSVFSTGAGIAALAAAVLLVCAAIWFLIAGRKKKEDEEESEA